MPASRRATRALAHQRSPLPLICVQTYGMYIAILTVACIHTNPQRHYISIEVLYYMPFLYFTATKKQKSDQATTLTTETDKANLNMEVCLGANYYKTGVDPEIKPELEYPEWLWSLLERDQPAQDSKQHWRRVRKAQAHGVIATLNEKQ